MKAVAIFISSVWLVLAGGCSTLPKSAAKDPDFVKVSAIVISFDPSGMVLHTESVGGIGCGSLDEAALATVRVLAPERYLGREFSIRLSPFGSHTPSEGTERLQQLDAEVNLEIMRVLLSNSPKQPLDLPAGEVRLIRPPNQALQHNDPSCHESCLRTPRASCGRG